VLLAFTNLTAAGEHAEQELVDVWIEGCQLKPLLQVGERLVVGNVLDEMLQ
jgi:hypothetical protein